MAKSGYASLMDSLAPKPLKGFIEVPVGDSTVLINVRAIIRVSENNGKTAIILLPAFHQERADIVETVLSYDQVKALITAA